MLAPEVRSVRVTGPLLTVEMLARACADVASRLPAAASRGESILLGVNGADVGVVPVAVWDVVRERLESILDEHVTFVETDDGRAAGRSAATTPPEEPRQSGSPERKLRVLIAQHDAAHRAQLLAAFTGAGFDVLGVGDGTQALRQLAARPAQVLVVDFELPKLAGDELLARARAERGSPVRVGVLIGMDLPHLLVPDCAAADIVMGQPLTASQVVERVRAILGARAERETG